MEGEISTSSTSVELVVSVQQLVEEIQDLPVSDQTKKHGKCTVEVNETDREGGGSGTKVIDHGGVCAICLSEIELQEIALVKGCEHAYCATCILRWASYKTEPTCPQCKYPFKFLNVHRSLDGSINDFMFEESVCLLLRAPWFEPLVVTEPYTHTPEEEIEDYYYNYYEDDEEEDEIYLSNFSNIRIGNRRWGDNGYVRSGRQQARPTQSRPDSYAGPSRQPSSRKEPVSKELVGRRAKRALKREAADKAAAAKHQQHLARFDRLK